MKRLLVVYVFVVLLLSACSTPLPQPFASPINPPLPPESVPTLYDTVLNLASAVGIGAIVAFLFERFKWFQGLTGDTRFFVMLGLTVGIPILAQIAIQFVPPDIWQMLEPYWQSIALGFLTFVGSQAAHLLNKAANGRSR